MVELRGKSTSPGFQSKDGTKYDTYEKMRQANIRFNEGRLKAKGLSNLPSLSSMSSVTPREKQVQAKKSPRSSARMASEPRRSSRIRKEPPAFKALGDNELDSDDKFVRKNPSSSRPKKNRRSNAYTLSDAERHALRQREHWIDDMDEYLERVQNISDANRRSVMRQVEKLVSGQGIRYQRWAEGTVFAAGRVITLAENFQTLFDEASSFEDYHGKDLGNGTYWTMPSLHYLSTKYFQVGYCVIQSRNWKTISVS